MNKVLRAHDLPRSFPTRPKPRKEFKPIEKKKIIGLYKNRDRAAYIARENVILLLFEMGQTYEQIGKIVNLCRQRVQQIVRPSDRVYVALYARSGDSCEDCGSPLAGSGHAHHIKTTTCEDISNFRYLCSSCHARQ